MNKTAVCIANSGFIHRHPVINSHEMQSHILKNNLLKSGYHRKYKKHLKKSGTNGAILIKERIPSKKKLFKSSKS